MRFPRPHCGVRGPRQNSGSIGQRWKRREALASRLVLMGRHHTNPPQPRHPTPQTANTATREGGPPAPNTKNGANTGGRATRHPPPPAGPTNTGQTTATRKKGGHEGAATTIRTTTNPPPPHHTAGQHGGRHNLVVVTAPGKRPATYRTWKLSPAAPMVLHPRGCGRVGNRHNTPPRGGAAHTSAAPPHTQPHTQQRGHTHAHHHATTRRTPHEQAGTHPHARAISADPTPTTPTRERAPAHTSPTHAQRRAPGRPIAPALLPA